jgi:putative PIN family toxin of toxin-antitoxin system
MNPASGGELLRVVVDTNVYISAFLHPERSIFQIVQQAAEHRYRLLISPAIVNEVGRVLREHFSLEEMVTIRRLKALTKAAEIVNPQLTLDVIREDPPDNRILECAVEGRAHLIVSGDRHLRRLKIYQGIPIVRPTDFLRTLGVA